MNGSGDGLKCIFEHVYGGVSTLRYFAFKAQPRESYCTSRPASYIPCVLFTPPPHETRISDLLPAREKLQEDAETLQI